MGVSQDLERWSTGRMLSSAARQVEREWNLHLSAWDLNHASLPVLVLLAQRNHSQRELAEAVGVTEQTMSRILARMERTGYLTSTPHAHDKRQHVISLSPTGAAVMREAAAPGPAEEMSTRGLSPDQVVQMRELLTLMILARPDPGDAAETDDDEADDDAPAPPG